MIGSGVASPALGGTASGPFDLMRGWSGGPWDYQYPWAGCGYPSFGFGMPYTWDQPLGVGQAGPYIWGAPLASPSLFLPEPTELPESGPESAPGSAEDSQAPSGPQPPVGAEGTAPPTP